MSNYNEASAPPIYAEAIAVNMNSSPYHHVVDAQPLTPERAQYESEQEAAARDDPHGIHSPVNALGAQEYLKGHKVS